VIRYMVLDTRSWLPGRKVLVSPEWIGRVEWTNRRVRLDLAPEAIRTSPEFDPKAPANREDEVRLCDYYGRPRYWEKAPRRTEGPLGHGEQDGSAGA